MNDELRSFCQITVLFFIPLCTPWILRVLRPKKDVSLYQNLNPDINFSANFLSSLCTPCEKNRDYISP